ncbi:transmembrane protein 119 [Pseudophryne corroboree]|uniref:transmembrane protein 119 n=1 Tax=Pseudophryne corroboree TaxID=495146 RepID=UPI003081211D
MGYLVTLCILLFFTCPMCLARYTTPEFENGSGDEEGTSLTSPTQGHELVGLTTENTVKVNGTATSFNLLESITQFLKEYMLLIIVVGSLVILLIFIVCTAVIMSHRHKASAYYPSSFSQKEYVNHDDKCGGPRSFNEIPEKAQDVKAEEVVDSTKQLQADILNAAQNLKSPTKGASFKEDQKIPEEPKETSEPSEKENTEEATTDKTQESIKIQEKSPCEKVEETPSEPPGECKPAGDSQEVPAEADVLTTEEQRGGNVEEANPVSPNCETENSPCAGQEAQQASEICGV